MKRSKYRNIKTVVNGITFDSKREAARYCELRLLEQAGEIQELKLQPVFKCVVGGELICRYRADFSYTSCGEQITEDVKSKITAKHPVYRLKKKLVHALFGVDIKETY